mgnify:CR=1 FL=1
MPPRRVREYLLRLADARCKFRHCSDLPCDECFCVVEHEYFLRLKKRRERESRRFSASETNIQKESA